MCMSFSDASERRLPGSAPEERPATAGGGVALRRHRALADPSRARILAELAAGGPLGARALAERVGLHVNTVRAHLGALADAALVERETLAPSGRGRPGVSYRATAAAADVEGNRRYRLLAEILTALVARLGPGPGPLEEIGQAWGRYLVESPPPYAAVPDGDAVARLLALLSDLGFEPRLQRASRGRRVLMGACPFLEVARAQRDVVCPIHLGLMRGALAELGAATLVTRIEPFARPDVCVAHLAGSRTA